MAHGFTSLGYLMLQVGLKIFFFFFPVWCFSLWAFPSSFRRGRDLKSGPQACLPALQRLAGLSASHCETVAPAQALLPGSLLVQPPPGYRRCAKDPPGAVLAGGSPLPLGQQRHRGICSAHLLGLTALEPSSFPLHHLCHFSRLFPAAGVDSRARGPALPLFPTSTLINSPP